MLRNDDPRLYSLARMPPLQPLLRTLPSYKDLSLFWEQHCHVCEWISLALPLPVRDPASIYGVLRNQGEDHFFWSRAGRIVIGAGATVRWHGIGSQRFQQAREVMTRFNAHSRCWGDTPPCWMGGFGFTGGDPSFFFVPKFQVSSLAGTMTLTCTVSTQRPWVEHLPLIEEVYEQLLNLPTAPLFSPLWTTAALPTAPPASMENLHQSICHALQQIQRGSLEKIVLAATLPVTLPRAPRIDQVLTHLGYLYPDCTLFALNHPQGGTFLGASPESLVRVQDHHLWTVALAGSTPRTGDPDYDHQLGQELLNSAKDRHEQHLVTDSIFLTLRRLGLDPQGDPSHPTVRQLSHIQHLQTLIQASLPTSLHILDVVAALHPTAAVAGIPRPLACEHIAQAEPFQRGFYAAPIGWLDPQGNGEFVVGIRSTHLNHDQATLYAGAGIVAGSVPERELQEIQLKWQALLPTLLRDPYP